MCNSLQGKKILLWKDSILKFDANQQYFQFTTLLLYWKNQDVKVFVIYIFS